MLGTNVLEDLWLNTYEMVNKPEFWLNIGSVVLKIIFIYVGAKIFISIFKKTVERVFRERANGPMRLTDRRARTLTSLLNNIAVNVIYFIAILLILSELNISLGPLLAGAGVVGLAVGFGAQSLVKDVITGFFIIYEDQFSVGDFIMTGKYSGTVEEIGLRVTKIQEWTGQKHMIPNGSITEVTNYSKSNSLAVVDLTFAWKEDITQVEKMLKQSSMRVYEQEDRMVGEPQVLGVQELSGTSFVIRITAECLPMKHEDVARSLRKVLKESLEQHGIELK